MKAKELLEALALPFDIAKVTISTQPITGHIRLAGGTAVAYNMLAAIEVNTPELDLGCCVPAQRFSQTLAAIAALAPDGEVKLSVKNKQLVMTAPHFRRTMPTLPADDFPVPEWPQGGEAISAWSGQVSALRFAGHAAASDDAERPFLNGVATKEGYVGASDGVRGAIAMGEAQLRDGLIIPTAAVRTICELQAVSAYATSEAWLAFIFPRGRYCVRLVAHKFPDLAKVLPAKHADQALQIERDALSRALGAYVKTKTAPHMKLSVEKSLVILGDETPDGSSRVEVGCVYEGAPWWTGVPAPQLAGALEALDGERLTISWEGGLKPVLLTGQKEGRRIAIMPMKL